MVKRRIIGGSMTEAEQAQMHSEISEFWESEGQKYLKVAKQQIDYASAAFAQANFHKQKSKKFGHAIKTQLKLVN